MAAGVAALSACGLVLVLATVAAAESAEGTSQVTSRREGLAGPAPKVDGWVRGQRSIPTASLATILAAVRAAGAPGPTGPAGAKVVLVNVWATWCDPCRAELPELLRFYRDHRARGLRLVMVSADEPEQEAEVARVLREAVAAAGLGVELPPTAFIKNEDDTTFVNGLDVTWSGALPATFAFDCRGARLGARTHAWLGPVTAAALAEGVGAQLGLTASSAGADSQSSARGVERHSRDREQNARRTTQ